MGIIFQQAFVVTKTEQILFTPISFPRLFGGKISLKNLVSGDILRLTQETKYTGAGPFELERQKDFTNQTTDKTARITPIREDDGIQWKVILDAASPSATVSIDVVIWEETVT